jgi:hypothetical protein
MVADVRRDGTFVRVTWHPEGRQFVISHWRDEVCVAATRVPVGAAPDLITLLARGLGESAAAPSPSPALPVAGASVRARRLVDRLLGRASPAPRKADVVSGPWQRRD